MSNFLLRIWTVAVFLGGVAIILDSASRLGADPGPPTLICPYVDLSDAIKDCMVDSPCGTDIDKNSCLGLYSHWKVETFPKECLKTNERRLCDEKSKLCKTYVACQWDPEAIPKCFLAGMQPNPPAFDNALKLIPGDCPE